ncbi:hypothetical protein FO526_35405, partial [Bacillus thuringiensis]|nr:hypothetical protein [Bacillus thuringiensis]
HRRAKITNLDSIQSNIMQFIKKTECNYGHTIARNMANDLTRLAVIAQTNDYLSELDSPRFIIRFKLHPTTGRLIVETINDKMKGYRYTCSPDRIHRH